LEANEFFKANDSVPEEPRQISPKMEELGSIKMNADEFKKSLDYNIFNSIESSNISIWMSKIEKKLDYNENDS